MSNYSKIQANENYLIAYDCRCKAAIADAFGRSDISKMYMGLAEISELTAKSWAEDTDIASVNRNNQAAAAALRQ